MSVLSLLFLLNCDWPSLSRVEVLPLADRRPRVDIDTVTFDTGSWEVTPDQVERLAVIADGINRGIAANPSEVFLITPG